MRSDVEFQVVSSDFGAWPGRKQAAFCAQEPLTLGPQLLEVPILGFDMRG
jgi:hypothetical protein